MTLIAVVVGVLLACVHQLSADESRREHKIHNIVLYPDLHSWCQTTPIKQIVATAGYEPVTIDNNVCVGACYSYSIPRTQPAEPGELIGPYCDSCQPKETQCYHVTLKSTAAMGKSVQKRVQIIANCSCSTCGKQMEQSVCDLDDANTSELPTSMRASHERGVEGAAPDVPELLAVGSAPIANATLRRAAVSVVDAEELEEKGQVRRTYALSEGVRRLLEQIDSESEDEGVTDEWMVGGARHPHMGELLNLVQGADGRLSDEDVMEFANFVNDRYDLDVDALRLKRVLQLYEHAQLRLRHRNFGMLGQADVEGNHLGMGHKKGAHIAMGLSPHHQDHHHHHHQHEVGEEQHLLGGGVGHLVMGPHGSLVVAPVEEKLSLSTDDVAPNHEGVVINYQHHHVALEERVNQTRADGAAVDAAADAGV